MPLPFFPTCIAIAFFMARAWKARRQAWGLPAFAVLGTVATWYVADVFYNNYKVYQLTIGPESLASAWWQVLWFVVAFGLFVKPICQALNGPLPEGCSRALVYIESDRLRQPEVQRRIDIFAGALLVVWILLMFIAVIQVKGNVLGIFAPYLGFRANPWARGQIGGGFGRYLSRCLFPDLSNGCLRRHRRSGSQSQNSKYCPHGLLPRAALLHLRPDSQYDARHDAARHSRACLLSPETQQMGKLGFLIAAFIAMNAWFTFVMASRGAGVGVARSFANEEIEEVETSRPDTWASTCSKNWPGSIGS